MSSATRRSCSASSPPRSLRIVFAGITTELLQTVGLLLAGGILVLRVCWKMWRELRAGHAEKDLEAEEALDDRDLDEDGLFEEHAPKKPLARRPGRSLWPTSPCRSTMFWRWQERHRNIQSSWSSVWVCR